MYVCMYEICMLLVGRSEEWELSDEISKLASHLKNSFVGERKN
jgi:hypothetical protein